MKKISLIFSLVACFLLGGIILPTYKASAKGYTPKHPVEYYDIQNESYMKMIDEEEARAEAAAKQRKISNDNSYEISDDQSLYEYGRQEIEKAIKSGYIVPYDPKNYEEDKAANDYYKEYYPEQYSTQFEEQEDKNAYEPEKVPYEYYHPEEEETPEIGSGNTGISNETYDKLANEDGLTKAKKMRNLLNKMIIEVEGEYKNTYVITTNCDNCTKSMRIEFIIDENNKVKVLHQESF